MTTEQMETCWRDLPERLEAFADHVVDGEASILEAASPREQSIPEPRPKVDPGSTMCSHISRRSHIAKCADGPKLQGPFAESAAVIVFHAPKCVVT